MKTYSEEGEIKRLVPLLFKKGRLEVGIDSGRVTGKVNLYEAHVCVLIPFAQHSGLRSYQGRGCAWSHRPLLSGEINTIGGWSSLKCHEYLPKVFLSILSC